MAEHRIDLDRVVMVDRLSEEAAFAVQREFVAGASYVVYASGRSHMDFLRQVAERLEAGLRQLPDHLRADWSEARFFLQREPTGVGRTYDGVGVVPIRAAEQ